MNQDITLEYADFIKHFLATRPEVAEDHRQGWEIYCPLPRERNAPMQEMLASVAKSRQPYDGPSFDADGFLADTTAWNVDIARRIATLDGLGDLDDTQISLLRVLRDHFLRFGAVPAIPHVCHLNGLAPDCLSRRFTSAREAWRIAGLPNPGEEVKAYL